MDELELLVDRARDGDLYAFSAIVRRFQDMAFAYAYSIIGDFHLAEDAAQEAFLQAYRDLGALRESEAFPGWFKKIVYKHGDRIKRKRQFQTVPLESVIEVASDVPGPDVSAESNEIRDTVYRAISSLPDNERAVTTLYYINGYTQKDVAEFLEVPVSTVNNRLHSSRKRLQERMVQMVNDELKSHALNEGFPDRVRLLLEMPRPLTIEDHPVRNMWLAFRACFPEFEEVELDEVCERSVSMLAQHGVFAIDEHRILRPELTSQMANHWIKNGGGPCQLITVGRVFRDDHHESETRLEVFHQAEVLWAAEDLDMRRLDEVMHRVAAQILPGLEFRTGSPLSYALISEGLHYESRWRDRWTSVAAGGIAKEEWLVKAGLDPSRFGAIGFAFGLERTVQVSLDLDDIRVLWRPPYVPETSRGQ